MPGTLAVASNEILRDLLCTNAHIQAEREVYCDAGLLPEEASALVIALATQIVNDTSIAAEVEVG